MGILFPQSMLHAVEAQSPSRWTTGKSPHPLLPHGSLLSRSSVLFQDHVLVPPCSPFPSSFPEAIALSGSAAPQGAPL